MSVERNISTSFQNIVTSNLEQNVLVIDNNVDIVELLEMHLQDLSIKVTKAFNGLKGLELAQNKNFDLIILNDILPGIDGPDICQSLRNSKNHTPILMLCAFCRNEKKQENEIGKTKFLLIKPFGIKAFKDQIKKILN